ncbi:MAG: AAA family ATPase, partial [Acidimicrobiales bacterium]|nr:AAA family ATPase [Acidimicrobiales bacterium]
MGDRAPVNNLPVKLTTFVGRSDEVAELHDLVCRTRLLTLTGAGGCGKSRLAAHVARQALPSFPDGAWFVELAPISEPELVPAAVAHILGVRPSPDQSELDAVIAFLAPRRALVVLDNCEHLLSEAARTAEAVARACPRVAVLTTSREPLRAEGETQWRVPSLSLPALDEDPDASDAVRLFLERAAQAEPRFTLTPANTDAVVSICCQLDGMPLAIELAAAGLGAFSVDDIAARLTHRFRLLTSGVRTALPRHQTLRASVDWSHDLLSNGEQMVLRRLGVFAGSFTVGGAEWVCAGAG